MNKFTNKIIKIIDSSKSFSFRSDRAKKFIDKENPIFILNCNSIPKDIENLPPGKINKITDNIEKILRSEIIDKASNFLLDCILEKDTFENEFTNLLNSKEGRFLVSSIYTMRVSIKDNCIYLSIFK